MFTSDDSYLDDVFFDTPTPTSTLATPSFKRRMWPPGTQPPTPDSLPPIAEKSPLPSYATATGQSTTGRDEPDGSVGEALVRVGKEEEEAKRRLQEREALQETGSRGSDGVVIPVTLEADPGELDQVDLTK